MQATIEILPSHKMDIAKWDACVCNSNNGLIYATSVYLNFMSDDWNGIVVNNYDCCNAHSMAKEIWNKILL
jgi:hypothetical protein